MIVGIDIGATWTRVGVVTGMRVERVHRCRTAELSRHAPFAFVGGRAAATQQEPFASTGFPPLARQAPHPPSTAEEFASGLAERVRNLLAEGASASPATSGHDGQTLTAVGVAVPGTIDRASGVVMRAVNLPFLDGFPLADRIAQSLGCPVTLLTDAEATTWGEYMSLDPRPARFVHLRLGTGVACGILIDGAFVPLDEPRATHAPTLIVDRSESARPCACGLRGCLETIASGPALLRLAGFDDPLSDLAMLRQRWLQGDRAARVAIDEAAAAIGVALTALHGRFRFEAVSIGGGVIAHLPELVAPAREAVSPTVGGQRVRTARLGDNAGIVGAAHAAENSISV